PSSSTASSIDREVSSSRCWRASITRSRSDSSRRRAASMSTTAIPLPPAHRIPSEVSSISRGLRSPEGRSVAAGVVAGLDRRHELRVLALLLGAARRVCDPLLVVAHRLERGSEQCPEPQQELRLLRQEPRGLAADALAFGIRAVHEVARLGLGIPDDELSLAGRCRAELVGGALGAHERASHRLLRLAV